MKDFAEWEVTPEESKWQLMVQVAAVRCEELHYPPLVTPQMWHMTNQGRQGLNVGMAIAQVAVAYFLNRIVGAKEVF